MSVRVHEQGRARVEPRIGPGRYVPIGLLAFIAVEGGLRMDELLI